MDRRFSSIVLALLIFAAFAVPAFAAESSSVRDYMESGYVVFSLEYLYHAFGMIRSNLGVIFTVGMGAFFVVLGVYRLLDIVGDTSR